LTAMRVIFPAERDLSLGEVDDAVIGDRHAMRRIKEIGLNLRSSISYAPKRKRS
jgi:hypothetical protein